MSGGLDARFGGPSFAAVATSVAVRRRGVANLFVFPFDGAAEPDAYPTLGLLSAGGVAATAFPLARRPRPFARRWGISPSFAWWLVRNARQFDVIHTHGAWTFTALTALLVGRLSGCVVILSSHETLTDFDISLSPLVMRIIKRALRRLFLRSFDAVVTSSQLEQADTDARRNRPVVIYHAVAAPLEPRRASHSGDQSFVIGYLGRLDPKKNVEILVDALVHLPLDTRLVVAGEGHREYEEALVARARDRGVEDRVEWRGFVGEDGKRELFDTVDVLAMPSAYECFGMVAAEAMVAGVPLLLSRRSGVAEVAARHEAGIIVEPTLRAVVAALGKANRDRESLAMIAERGRIAARDEFSLDAHGARVVRVYEQSLARRRRVVPAPPAAAR